MSLNKEARMILLMAKVRQTNSEDLNEQKSLLDTLKSTRNAIKEEIKIIKGIVEEKPDEKEEIEEVEAPIEAVETDIHTKFDLNPNLKTVRQIKKKAKCKVDTRNHTLEDSKQRYSKIKGDKYLTKHRENEALHLDLLNRPPFK